MRAQAQGLFLVPVGSISASEAAAVGRGADGNEATLDLRMDNILLRVTAVVPNGPAEDVARQVADTVVAKRAQLSARAGS